MQIKTASITLHYVCPDCRATSEQPLTDIVENGTHTCDCGRDMELADEVEVSGDKPE